MMLWLGNGGGRGGGGGEEGSLDHHLISGYTHNNIILLLRPIAGNINLCPNAFNTSTDEYILTVAKHEAQHALVSSN